MADSHYHDIADFEHLVHTGIYSEETGRPQPLRFTIRV
jgi:dihydroneopterin aldolase